MAKRSAGDMLRATESSEHGRRARFVHGPGGIDMRAAVARNIFRPDRDARRFCRVVLCFLSLALLVAPAIPGQKRFHCRITGARDLTECCCKPEATPASEPSCCAPHNDCPAESSDPNEPCGCCDITYERGDLPAAVAVSHTNVPEATATVALAAPDPDAPSWPAASSGLRPRGDSKTPRSGRAVCLRHCSLLI